MSIADLVRPLNIVYFGSSGSLSTLPLQSLLAGLHRVIAVVVYEPELQTRSLAVVAAGHSSSVKTIAFQQSIRIIRLSNDFSDIMPELDKISFDLIITSCFARKIPAEILSLARLGAINLHPSLLPAYRGPDPVFWQLRDMVTNTGVTLHLMTDYFDKGAIVVQRALMLDKADTLAEANDRLGLLAAKILSEVLDDVEHTIQQAQIQDETASSYQSRPDIADYELSDDWEASRLFNFVTATLGRVAYYPITLKGKSYKIVRVVNYHVSIQRNLSISGSKICFSCHSGSVCAELLTD